MPALRRSVALAMISFFLMGFSLLRASPEVQIGFKGGLNLSNIDVTETDAVFLDWETRSGVILGGFLAVFLSENFAVQQEFFYSRKGAKVDADILGTTLREDFKVDYFEMPLLLKWRFPLKKSLSLNILTGPYLGLKVNAEAETHIAGFTQQEELENIRDLDAGLVVGTGLEFPFGQSFFLVEIRYHWGLTKINDPGLEDTKVKNGSLALVAGIGF